MMPGPKGDTAQEEKKKDGERTGEKRKKIISTVSSKKKSAHFMQEAAWEKKDPDYIAEENLVRMKKRSLQGEFFSFENWKLGKEKKPTDFLTTDTGIESGPLS